MSDKTKRKPVFREACPDLLTHSVMAHRMHCSLPGSSVHGISQAEILEWAAISSSI